MKRQLPKVKQLRKVFKEIKQKDGKTLCILVVVTLIG
tara:strand:+ start:1916 stop:2026 length:111 start_codon:yes stop_codon:yes gene_type:complete